MPDLMQTSLMLFKTLLLKWVFEELNFQNQRYGSLSEQGT